LAKSEAVSSTYGSLPGFPTREATTLYDGENRLATGCDGQHVGNGILYVLEHRSSAETSPSARPVSFSLFGFCMPKLRRPTNFVQLSSTFLLLSIEQSA
jgi:hypothetical protein